MTANTDVVIWDSRTVRRNALTIAAWSIAFFIVVGVITFAIGSGTKDPDLQLWGALRFGTVIGALVGTIVSFVLTRPLAAELQAAKTYTGYRPMARVVLRAKDESLPTDDVGPARRLAALTITYSPFYVAQFTLLFLALVIQQLSVKSSEIFQTIGGFLTAVIVAAWVVLVIQGFIQRRNAKAFMLESHPIAPHPASN